jgi:hypothetical protein
MAQARKPKTLRIVGADETPPSKPDEPKKPLLTVAQAAESNEEMELLLALRRTLARDIDSAATPPRDRAALSRQVLLIQQQIEALKAAGEDDPLGEAADTPDEEFDASSF